MGMFGKYPKVKVGDKWLEQNGMDGAPKAWPTTDCSKDVRLTSQAPREDVDINKIVAKMNKGLAVAGNPALGKFDDVSEFGGLEESIIQVQRANEAFMTLPADLRERFDNDPVKLVEFLGDDKNYDEAAELGIVTKKPPKVGESEPVPPATGDKA